MIFSLFIHVRQASWWRREFSVKKNKEIVTLCPSDVSASDFIP